MDAIEKKIRDMQARINEDMLNDQYRAGLLKMVELAEFIWEHPEEFPEARGNRQFVKIIDHIERMLGMQS